jgi:hypothetical protein
MLRESFLNAQNRAVAFPGREGRGSQKMFPWDFSGKGVLGKRK